MTATPGSSKHTIHEKTGSKNDASIVSWDVIEIDVDVVEEQEVEEAAEEMVEEDAEEKEAENNVREVGWEAGGLSGPMRATCQALSKNTKKLSGLSSRNSFSGPSTILNRLAHSR